MVLDMANADNPVVQILSESAVRAVLADSISRESSQKVFALLQRLINDRLAGIRDIVPSYIEVAVTFDPQRLSLLQVRDWLRGHCDDLDSKHDFTGRQHDIPVSLGGESGSDLADIAAAAGISEAAAIDMLLSGSYFVHMLGFLPGMPYMGGLDPVLHRPRRSQIIPHAPAGTVAIANGQLSIFPADTPTGWWRIGWSPVQLFWPSTGADSPPRTLLAPGDEVRFVTSVAHWG
jgi:KipI family sensor histidine kinase inhibitor